SPAQDGSAASIAATYTAAWGGIYLHCGTNLTAADFQTLRFYIHGGSAGGQHLVITAYDANSVAGSSLNVPRPVATTWTLVQIPVSSSNVPTISGLVWQDSSGGPQPTFSLDEITLVGAAINVTLAVDVNADRHAISPDIYGLNFADPA